MSGSTNYVNYEVLESGVSVYNNQSEAITNVMSSLASMNDELQSGWQNDTARAFINMYNEKYAPALKEAAEALADISSYIAKYMAARIEEDSAGAASFG